MIKNQVHHYVTAEDLLAIFSKIILISMYANDKENLEKYCCWLIISAQQKHRVVINKN